MIAATNGHPVAGNPRLDALARGRRIRQLINQISARQPAFRGLVHALRRDLGELCDLSGTDASNVFARMIAWPPISRACSIGPLAARTMRTRRVANTARRPR